MTFFQTTEYRGNFPKIHAIVKGELFTGKEVEKYNIPARILQSVEVSKKGTYYIFGARMARG